MASAGIELATAWVSIVPSMQGMRSGIAKGLSGVEADGAAAGRRFGKAFGSSAADGASSNLAQLKAAAEKAAASAGDAEAKLARAIAERANVEVLYDSRIRALRGEDALSGVMVDQAIQQARLDSARS